MRLGESQHEVQWLQEMDSRILKRDISFGGPKSVNWLGAIFIYSKKHPLDFKIYYFIFRIYN